MFYTKVYEDPALLKQFFSDEFIECTGDDDSEYTNSRSQANKEYIQRIQLIQPSTAEEPYYDINSAYSRSWIVRPKARLEALYQLFQTCIEVGCSTSYKCQQSADTYYKHDPLPMCNFLEMYLHGSKPIEVLQPEMHQKFVLLFTPIS